MCTWLLTNIIILCAHEKYDNVYFARRYLKQRTYSFTTTRKNVVVIKFDVLYISTTVADRLRLYISFLENVRVYYTMHGLFIPFICHNTTRRAVFSHDDSYSPGLSSSSR